MGFFPKSWAEYPPEYNRKVHGYYNPSVYYGKRDTPFSEVKLADLKAWFGRRNKSPKAILGAISRAYWRHHLTWMAPKKPGIAGVFHLFYMPCFLSFLLDYTGHTKEKTYRYH